MSSGFFSSPRGRLLKFPAGQYGTRHTLYVTQEVELEQQCVKGQLLWRDEEKTKPRMQAIISGYVTEGLSSPNDDGFRTVYVRGGIREAIGAACRRAGVAEPGFGMALTLEYTHDGPQPEDPEMKPPKEYFATLEVVDDAENDPRFHGQRCANQRNGRTGARRAVRGMASGQTAH